MDQWITDYLAEAKVVVPLPNPKFDPATIGVQKGGLKMPRAKKKPGDAAPAATVSKKLMLGWIARNADVTAKGDLLEITAAVAVHISPMPKSESMAQHKFGCRFAYRKMAKDDCNGVLPTRKISRPPAKAKPLRLKGAIGAS